jgi:hypothetical protein
MYKESEYSKCVNDERERNFIRELKELLSKHKVAIELEEDSSSYYGSSCHINICFDGYRDEEKDECISYRDLDIGNGTTLSPDGSVTI